MDIISISGAFIAKDVAIRNPEIILTCGSKDQLYERNLAAIRVFDAKGIEYNCCPIDTGVHDYSCFDEGLRYAFEISRGSEALEYSKISWGTL